MSYSAAWRWLALVSLAALTAYLTGGGAGAEPQQLLLFASDRAPNLSTSKLYVLDVGRAPRLLTPPGFADYGAAWLPGGRSIVVARQPDVVAVEPPPTHLVRVRASDGLLVGTLTNGTGEDCPLPSPDGGRLAYCEETPHQPGISTNQQLWVAGADGSDAHRVAGADGLWNTGEFWDSRASWAPDGHALAVAAFDTRTIERQEEPRLLLVGPRGAVLRRLGRARLIGWLKRDVIAIVRGPESHVYLITPTGRVIRRVRGAAASELLLYALDRPGTRSRLCAQYDRQLALCVPGTTRRRPLAPTYATQSVTYAALAWAPDGHRLLYSVAVDVCYADIFAAVPGSTSVRRLTAGPYDELEPVLSPDGTSLAFVDTRGGQASVYVKQLGDGSTRRLGRGSDVSWSPDGRSLVLATGTGLVVSDAEGKRPRTIAPGAYRGADWSPDGRTVVAARGRYDSDSQLVVVPAAGGVPTPLGIHGIDPAWSPDGAHIAYSSGGIWIANADGSGARQLTRIGQDWNRDITDDVHPAWSPGGDRIAFASGISLYDFIYTGVHGDAVEPYPYVIESIRLDGTDRQVLIQGPGADFDPSWGR